MTVIERPRPAAVPDDRPLRVSPPWDRRRIELTVSAIAGVVLATWAIRRTGIWDLATVFGEEARGKVERFLFGSPIRPGALPPRFDRPGAIFDKLLETFFIAVGATFLATLLSIPLAFLAARNTTPHRIVRLAARGVIVFSRTVPDVIFAFIFVRVYRIGPLPGMLAIGFHAIGMIGKLMADAIEQSDPGPRQAIAAQGGSWLQQMTTGVLPQVIPSFLGTILFRLDINFRASTVVGLVGAGGIGQLFLTYTGNLRWDLAIGVVVATMATVLVVDQLSNRVRKALLSADSEAGRTGKVPFVVDPDTVRPPFDRYRRRLAVFATGAASLVVAAYLVTGISLQNFFLGLRPRFGAPEPGSLPTVWYVGRRLLPFDFSTNRPVTTWWSPLVRKALLDTVATGFAAATIGIALALPVAYLAARNVSPNRVTYQGSRFLLVLLRATPELIVAVILVVALGLGLVPGVVALVLGVIGFGGKLFADAIEDVPGGPRDGVRSVGASRIQETATGVTPQFVPALVGQGLYILDINIRSSAVLGVVGAGGIGAVLSNFLEAGRFEETGGILAVIFLVVFALERYADWLRARLI